MKTSAIPLSHLQSLSGSRLAARLPAFAPLTKPRVMARSEGNQSMNIAVRVLFTLVLFISVGFLGLRYGRRLYSSWTRDAARGCSPALDGRSGMAEKSSLRGEAKMHPPQTSGKRPEFDPPTTNFTHNIKYLIRGGAKGIRTECLSLMRSRILGIFPSRMSNYRTTVRHGRCERIRQT
jgi:hypothetical protein